MRDLTDEDRESVQCPTVEAGAGRQLELPFEGNGEGQSRGAEMLAEGESRQNVRGSSAGRLVRLPVGRPMDEVRLENAVAVFLPPGKALRLTLTDNHYCMISVKRQPELYQVRIHRMFESAEPRIVRALARYVVHNDRRASDLLSEFIKSHEGAIKPAPRRMRHPVLRTKGQVHDLQIIFDSLNRRYFGGELQAQITWGPAVPKRQRRSIKMGSFSIEDRIIRVHPALDKAEVPEFFVAWIVYHEMLHGKHPVTLERGRRCFHTAAFTADERSYHDYERACCWERENVDRLFT